MKHILPFLCIVIAACSSTPQKSAESAAKENLLQVNLNALKKFALSYVNQNFQKDLKERRLDSEEISLRDYAYRFEGRTYPPLSYEVTKPWMTEKEFGKSEEKGNVDGPADIVVDNPKRFIFFYRQNAFMGEKIGDSECKLTVLKTKPFEPTTEEVRMKDGMIKDPLYFNSLTLDLDKTLKEGTRNSAVEDEITKIVEGT